MAFGKNDTLNNRQAIIPIQIIDTYSPRGDTMEYVSLSMDSTFASLYDICFNIRFKWYKMT